MTSAVVDRAPPISVVAPTERIALTAGVGFDPAHPEVDRAEEVDAAFHVAAGHRRHVEPALAPLEVVADRANAADEFG